MSTHKMFSWRNKKIYQYFLFETCGLSVVMETLYDMSRGTAFPTRLYVHPAKTQIRLHIQVVRSVLAGCSVGSQGFKASSGRQ